MRMDSKPKLRKVIVIHILVWMGLVGIVVWSGLSMYIKTEKCNEIKDELIWFSCQHERVAYLPGFVDISERAPGSVSYLIDTYGSVPQFCEVCGQSGPTLQEQEEILIGAGVPVDDWTSRVSCPVGGYSDSAVYGDMNNTTQFCKVHGVQLVMSAVLEPTSQFYAPNVGWECLGLSFGVILLVGSTFILWVYWDGYKQLELPE